MEKEERRERERQAREGRQEREDRWCWEATERGKERQGDKGKG